VRAGVIVLSMLLAGGIGRRYDRLTVLSWVGVGLIIWRPMDVSSLGYQLSMGITGVLVLVSIHHQGKPGKRHAHNDQLASRWIETWRWIRGWLVGALKLNVLCWAVAMPVIVYHTGIVSVLAPLASVVLVPMVGVLMALGYLQVLIGMISPELGAHTIGMIDVPAMLVEGVAVRADGLAYSSMTIGIISGWLCGFTSVFVAIFGTGLVHWRDRRAWMVCGVLGVWWIGELGAWGIVREGIGIDTVAMRVDMLDVEDGSCVIVQSDGKAMLWDCGSLDWRVGSMVERAARHAGVGGRVKIAIITHDNLDHFNGLLDCSRSLGIERVYVSKTMFDDGSYGWRTMRDQLALRGIEVIEIQRGDELQIGQATLTCLWPDPEFIESLSEAMSENNQSVVVRIKTKDGQSVLLCGDIEHEAIEAIESLEPELRADIVELPHHGSRRTGSVGFVESLSPSVVLQSTGPSRSGMAYWDGLKDQTRWYTTADHGGVWVEINQDGTLESGSVLDD
jgi:competence protein ComEC